MLADVDLSSSEGMSPESQAELADILTRENLGTDVCCSMGMKFNKATCHCDSYFRTVLSEAGVGINPLISILEVIEDVCGTFKIATC